VIIWVGMSISSAEIEALLLVCPGIADAAVVGTPDTIMGERVCAFVVQKPGRTVELTAVNAYFTQKKGTAI
jgi:acyl-CoA synthetase